MSLIKDNEAFILSFKKNGTTSSLEFPSTSMLVFGAWPRSISSKCRLTVFFSSHRRREIDSSSVVQNFKSCRCHFDSKKVENFDMDTTKLNETANSYCPWKWSLLHQGSPKTGCLSKLCRKTYFFRRFIEYLFCDKSGRTVNSDRFAMYRL